MHVRHGVLLDTHINILRLCIDSYFGNEHSYLETTSILSARRLFQHAMQRGKPHRMHMVTWITIYRMFYMKTFLGFSTYEVFSPFYYSSTLIRMLSIALMFEEICSELFGEHSKNEMVHVYTIDL